MNLIVEGIQQLLKKQPPPPFIGVGDIHKSHGKIGCWGFTPV